MIRVAVAGAAGPVRSLYWRVFGKSDGSVQRLEDAFAALPSKIPGIASYKWGTNVSPEKHDRGFTHCFILGFKSEKDRDDYLVHPDHKAFGKVLGPVHLQAVQVQGAEGERNDGADAGRITPPAGFHVARNVL